MKKIHTNNEFITKINYLDSWDELIKYTADCQLFVTLEYDIPQKDFYAEKGMSFLLKAVQRSVYPNSYIKRNDCFKGFSIAERHTKSIKKLGKLHFHNLISLGSIDATEEFITKVERSFEEKVLKLNYNTPDNNTRIAVSPTALDIQRIYDQPRLADYCLKDTKKKKKKASKVSFIDWQGAKEYRYYKDIHLATCDEQYYFNRDQCVAHMTIVEYK